MSSIVASPPAHADNGFHGYSTAVENSAAGQYTGIRVTRLDRTAYFVPNTGCSQPFTGDPVYQTQWVIITADAANWLEIGTGHQCGDSYRYWFWGFGYGGSWFPLGTQGGITNEMSHTFAILKTGGTYNFTIDGVQEG